MNKQQILNYILNIYNKLIDEYGECNDFPTEFPNQLNKEGFITNMIKFEPGNEIIFTYKITKHWWSSEYNGTEIKITLDDKAIQQEKNDMDDIMNMISVMKIN